MASNGIKDRVAIVGMGCTKFGEHWDKGPDDLLIDAAYAAYESAGIDPNDVDAYDVAMAIGVEKLKDSGYSGLVVSSPANDGTLGNMTAPASFSLLAPAYFKKYGLEKGKGKEVLAR